MIHLRGFHSECQMDTTFERCQKRQTLIISKRINSFENIKHIQIIFYIQKNNILPNNFIQKKSNLGRV